MPMPITLSCTCGARYNIKEEFAGKTLQCPQCKANLAVPGAAATAPNFNGIDPAFHRDKFLLHQQHMSISEKYRLWDEAGKELLFIERPSHMLRNLGALLAGFTVGLFFFF